MECSVVILVVVVFDCGSLNVLLVLVLLSIVVKIDSCVLLGIGVFSVVMISDDSCVIICMLFIVWFCENLLIRFLVLVFVSVLDSVLIVKCSC